MNIERNITACFTGGRPKSLYPTYAYAQSRTIDYANMIANIAATVTELYLKRGIKIYITGGAQGFDQLAFRAVESVKRQHPDIKNLVYIPFNKQESMWADTGLFSKQEYHWMLSKADWVKVCTEIDPTVVAYNNIVKALFTRNECMCNDSKIVIGQFPDDISWHDKSIKGGTAGCLRYAESKDLELIVKDFRP